MSSVWPAGFYLGLGIENLCTCERNVKKILHRCIYIGAKLAGAAGAGAPVVFSVS